MVFVEICRDDRALLGGEPCSFDDALEKRPCFGDAEKGGRDVFHDLVGKAISEDTLFRAPSAWLCLEVGGRISGRGNGGTWSRQWLQQG